MTEKVAVKAYILKSLDLALERECASCGCSKSSIINDAILRKVRDMAQQRRVRELAAQLPGQQEMEVN